MDSNSLEVGFAALSKETRIRILKLLANRGDSGMAAGDIATELGLAQSTSSFHLGALEKAGLLKSERHQRHVIYSVNHATLRTLLGFLIEAYCGGRSDLIRKLEQILPDIEIEQQGMAPAFNVLFLCTHNSARSIIAEAILKNLGKGHFNTYSAGSDPAGQPMPEVLERLSALDHNISNLHSKSWDVFVGPDAPKMDFVIAMCDTLDGQVCPDFGEMPMTASWPFPDPAKFTGSSAERMSMINVLYGMIRRRLEIFTSLPFTTLDRVALKARLDELGAYQDLMA